MNHISVNRCEWTLSFDFTMAIARLLCRRRSLDRQLPKRGIQKQERHVEPLSHCTTYGSFKEGMRTHTHILLLCFLCLQNVIVLCFFQISVSILTVLMACRSRFMLADHSTCLQGDIHEQNRSLHFYLEVGDPSGIRWGSVVERVMHWLMHVAVLKWVANNSKL